MFFVFVFIFRLNIFYFTFRFIIFPIYKYGVSSVFSFKSVFLCTSYLGLFI